MKIILIELLIILYDLSVMNTLVPEVVHYTEIFILLKAIENAVAI